MRDIYQLIQYCIMIINQQYARPKNHYFMFGSNQVHGGAQSFCKRESTAGRD